MQYRPEIDGLRAVAVIPVILFHAGFELFSGGFVGVDVFFVISGYLITTILIESFENKQFSLFRFYERRARRILPALFFVIVFTYFAALNILNPFDFKEFSQSVFATSIFSSNIFFYLKSDYFDTASELKPLLHTWSLSVEEQYYFIFPVFLYLSWHFKKEKLFWIIVALATISFLLSEWGWRNSPSANFYLPHTRAWELFSGSIAAFIVQKKGVRKNNLLSIIGLIAILFSIFYYDKNTPFPSIYSLAPVSGVVLIALFSNKNTITAKILSTRLLVGIGLISYSAYLWHQPLLSLTRHYIVGQLSLPVSLLVIVLTFFFSFFTWRYVETPFRTAKQGVSNTRKALFVSVCAISIIGIIGLYGHIEKGFPNRNENMLRLAQNGGLSFECSGASVDNARCKSNTNPQIAVWGDSYAMHFTRALSTSFPEKGVHQLTLSSCPPAPKYDKARRKASVTCKEFNSNVANFLENRELHSIKTIFLAASSNLANPSLVELITHNIRTLKDLGYQVVVVSPTVKFTSSEQCITLAMRGKKPLADCEFSFDDAINAKVFDELTVLTNMLDVKFVNLSDFMCEGGKCKLEKDGYLLVRDAGHLTNEVQPSLGEYFQQIDVLSFINGN